MEYVPALGGVPQFFWADFITSMIGPWTLTRVKVDDSRSYQTLHHPIASLSYPLYPPSGGGVGVGAAAV